MLTSKLTAGQNTSSQIKQKPSQSQPQSKSSKSKMVSSDIVPKRFGLNFKPPQIILEYLIPQTGKLYHHKMKLLKLNAETPTPHALEYLKKKHYQYFMGNKLPDAQISQLIDKLKVKLKNATAINESKRPETASTLASNSLKQTPQLNTKTANNLSNQNKKANQEFDDYGMGEDIYDYTWKKTQNNNKPQSAPLQKNQTNLTKVQQSTYNGTQSKKIEYDEAYDDEEEYGDEYEEDEYGEEDEYMDEEEYQRLYEEMGYDHLDLNKMSNEELAKHKAIMEQIYLKNIKRPGDPGYKYDVQKEFQPHLDNDWDMDEDDDADIV